MKRKKLSRGQSGKVYRKGGKTNIRNVNNRPMRGGIRL